MSTVYNTISQSVFELEKSYLHKNMSEFREKFNEKVKYGLICIFAHPRAHYTKHPSKQLKLYNF